MKEWPKPRKCMKDEEPKGVNRTGSIASRLSAGFAFLQVHERGYLSDYDAEDITSTWRPEPD